MNTELLTYFWAFFVVWFTLRHIYRYAVLPAVHDWARFRIFSLRDELRRIERTRKDRLEGKFSYRFMENVFNASIHTVSTISVSRMISAIRNGNHLRVQIENDLKKFDSEAPAELKSLDKKFFKAIVFVTIANSPFLVLFAFLGALVSKIISVTNPLQSLKNTGRTMAHAPQRAF